MPNEQQPPLRAVPMTLFPTLGSLDEAVAFAETKVTGVNKNEMFIVLMVYHNSLLKAVEDAIQKNH